MAVMMMVISNTPSAVKESQALWLTGIENIERSASPARKLINKKARHRWRLHRIPKMILLKSLATAGPSKVETKLLLTMLAPMNRVSHVGEPLYLEDSSERSCNVAVNVSRAAYRSVSRCRLRTPSKKKGMKMLEVRPENPPISSNPR